MEYIKNDEGIQVDYKQQINWAINKFKTRKESEQWCQRSTEEETIILLQAHANALMCQTKTSPTGRSNGGAKKDIKQGSTRGAGVKASQEWTINQHDG